jgi:enoyl-CoA hydratase/carnithine racemase
VRSIQLLGGLDAVGKHRARPPARHDLGAQDERGLRVRDVAESFGVAIAAEDDDEIRQGKRQHGNERNCGSDAEPAHGPSIRDAAVAREPIVSSVAAGVAFRFFDIDTDGDVTVVRMNRPPVNAIDPELAAEGTALLEELRDERGGAVVITGSGGSFCAGLDLKVAPTLDAAQQHTMRDAVNNLLGGWALFPRPVVTAVNGHAIAGGLILALCGDWRVVGSEGSFGLTEVNVGVPYPPAAIAIVRSELSPPAARRLALGGQLIDSQAACDEGLFDERVEDAELLERAVEAARRLAPLAGPAYTETKRALRVEVVSAIAPAAIGADTWLADDHAARAREMLDSG